MDKRVNQYKHVQVEALSLFEDLVETPEDLKDEEALSLAAIVSIIGHGSILAASEYDNKDTLTLRKALLGLHNYAALAIMKIDNE